MEINELEQGGPTGDRRDLRLIAALFGVVALLAGGDVVADIREGATWTHWLVEVLLFVVGTAGVIVMVRRLRRLEDRSELLEAEAEVLAEKLERAADEAAQWREEAEVALKGLGVAIDRQLDRWELTDAEKEVALLLLKGLSHKEVAAIRETGAATARQQAAAIYKKAGLAGRNDLSAFFLEDLLLPASSEEE